LSGYDNTLFFAKIAEQKSKIIQKINLKDKDFLLATVHRDYNTDNLKNFINIIKAFNLITNKFSYSTRYKGSIFSFS